MEQNDFIKTGEDKTYEYYRNDSEVLSGDGEEEAYEEILNSRKEFTVKIDNKQLTIKKRTLDKIMILSESQPEEQILFSHYKTMQNPNKVDNLRKNLLSNDNINSKKQNNGKIEDPLISYKNSNENNNILVKDNTPVIEGDKDADNMMLKQTQKTDDQMQFNLPPKVLRLKWFYLILVLCGLLDVIYFFYCLFQIQMLIWSLFIMIFGLIIIFTGLYGYNKIGHKIYNDQLLNILTLACAILPIPNIVFMLLISGAHLIFGLIVGALTIVFAILCFYITSQLRKDENYFKDMQMEKLL
jgi:hypothetical protein